MAALFARTSAGWFGSYLPSPTPDGISQNTKRAHPEAFDSFGTERAPSSGNPSSGESADERT